MRTPLLLAGILLLSQLSPENKSFGQSTSKSLSPVVVEEVVEMEVNQGYRIVGAVEPLRTSTIGAAIGGRVEDFLVEMGQRVEAGEALVRLRTQTLLIELDAANAQLELYLQELAELENGSRPEDVQEAEAIADGAKAAMENAIKQFERLTALSRSRAATEVDLDNASERALTTRFTYSAAEAALRRIREGPRVEQIAQRRAQVELQKQQIRLIEDRIEKHTIHSPFDGYVSAKYSEIGAWINGGDPLVQIIELDRVEIRAPATAEYAARLALGDSVRVEFPELPDKLLIGSVDRIVPIADTRARTYPVFIRLNNEFRAGNVPQLLAGMLARVELAAGVEHKLPLVPKDALVLNEKDRTVFIVEPNPAQPGTGRVHKVSVDLGVAMDNLIQVSGDISEGQLVVVVGNERLHEDEEVRFVLDPNDQPPGG